MSPPSERPNLWYAFLAELNRVEQKEFVPAKSLETLRHPRKMITAAVPVRMDTGEVHYFTGYRVHHSISRGPAQGGIRYRPGLSLDEVRGLAGYTTIRSAVAGLPFGGAQGGVDVDPKALSAKELERLTRRYSAELVDIIGPDKDVPAPDVGTNAQVMAWLMDTYSQNKGTTTTAIVTGKPSSMGGSREYAEIGGRGVVSVVSEVAHLERFELAQSSVAVHGFGSVGRSAALGFFERGVSVVAVADLGGAIYRHEGLDVPDLVRYKAETGSVAGFPGARALGPGNLITLPVDVLVLASIEGLIDGSNAESVQARFIIETANHPITLEADELFASKGIVVVPDVLASIGIATANYFEWVQDLNNFYWTEREIKAAFELHLQRSVADVYAFVGERSVSWRLAAYALAVSRIHEASVLRGLYP